MFIMTKTKISKSLLAILAVPLIITVFYAIQISSLGAILVNLESKNKSLVDENISLNSEVMKSGSLTSASEKAEELGFSRPSSIIYLNNQESVARLP